MFEPLLGEDALSGVEDLGGTVRGLDIRLVLRGYDDVGDSRNFLRQIPLRFLDLVNFRVSLLCNHF
ncbi:hypothetical protein H7J77_12390 [Mycolicibacillus parakoreensis]|uniref:Uncharacterized protein n=1 Tax=Mycolicibacillus parakoreensis TaxID=1069221 RepID=A0ABY3U1M7_9MYCO|nr:hypothetical protein [Mycolicibacillus parakoreensis]MCV7316335.1 hypothetical protein [Mycolicibacillus parakoreensis]ULN52581.1 hypothetical protein MIU77_17370 [Mycolicibacillus parakoreensis]